MACKDPLQDRNCDPEAGSAERVTEVPEAIHGPAGLEETEPAPAGDPETAIMYSVTQFHVIVELLLIVIETLLVEPEAGTSPVPVNPVQTYRTPVGPSTGEATVQVRAVPAKKLVTPTGGVGEPRAEATVMEGPLGWKFPVTVEGAVIVNVSGLTVDESGPLQSTKWY